MKQNEKITRTIITTTLNYKFIDTVTDTINTTTYFAFTTTPLTEKEMVNACMKNCGENEQFYKLVDYSEESVLYEVSVQDFVLYGKIIGKGRK